MIYKNFTAEHAEYAERFYRLIIIMASAVSANSAVNYKNLENVTIFVNKCVKGCHERYYYRYTES